MKKSSRLTARLPFGLVPLIALLLAFTCFSACKKGGEGIVKTWLGDAVEATDPNDVEAKIAAAAFGSIIKTMKFEFYADGKLSAYVMGRGRAGKYAIAQDHSTLTMTFDDGEAQVYELAALNEGDMYLKSTDKKVNLRFVAAGARP